MTEADSPEPAPTAQHHTDAPPTNPFVPRYREPWVNPAKRTAAIISGLAAAVVLLTLGFVLGLGVGGDGHHRHRLDGPIMRPDGMYRQNAPYLPPGYRMPPGYGHRFQGPGPSTPPVAPRPSSSHS